jgi:hypothetical protein
MTVKLNTIDYIIFAAIGLLIAWFLWFRCNPSPLPKQKLSVDSTVINKYKADTAFLHDVIRNHVKDREGLIVKVDSLQKIVNTDESRLGTRAKTINDLVGKIKGYEQSRDTTALLDIIDSLTNEVEAGITAVWDYERQNHRLDSALRSVISSDSAIKATLGTEVVDCNNFSFKLQLDVQRLREDSSILANKLIKSKKTAKIAILVDAILAGILILKK